MAVDTSRKPQHGWWEARKLAFPLQATCKGHQAQKLKDLAAPTMKTVTNEG